MPFIFFPDICYTRVEQFKNYEGEEWTTIRRECRKYWDENEKLGCKFNDKNDVGLFFKLFSSEECYCRGDLCNDAKQKVDKKSGSLVNMNDADMNINRGSTLTSSVLPIWIMILAVAVIV